MELLFGRWAIFLFLAAAPGPQVGESAKVVGRIVGQEGQFKGARLLLTEDFVVIGDWLEQGPADEYEESPSLGTVYVLRRDGALTREAAQKLVAPEGTEMRHFGVAIATNGAKIAIAAEGRTGPCSNTAGCVKQRPNAVYVYKPDAEGHWELEATLIAKDAAGAIDEFAANSLAYSGDRLFVGSWLPHDDRFAPGVVYVFKQREDSTWSQVSTIAAPDPKSGLEFGWSLAASKDRLLVGQPHYKVNGAAFLFAAAPNNAWRLSARATPRERGCGFGEALALDDDQAIVATNSYRCAAYIYDIQDSRLRRAVAVTYPQAAGSLVGGWLALHRGMAAISASGRVLLYRRRPEGWRQVGVVLNPDGPKVSSFPDALALHGDALVASSVVGTLKPGPDDPPNSVWVYELSAR